ncbi:MAG: hypothetical protein R3Y13_04855 [bacterium]
MKKVILLVCVLLLSGCEVEYNLVIEGDIIKEMSSTKHSTNEEEYIETATLTSIYQSYYNKNIPLYNNDENFNYHTFEPLGEVEYYDVSYNNKVLSGEAEFSITKFSNSYLLNNCATVMVTRSGDTVKINSDNVYKCFNQFELLEEIVINIETDEVVVYSSADYKTDNVHTWIINANDYDSVALYYVYDSDEENSEENNGDIEEEYYEKEDNSAYDNYVNNYLQDQTEVSEDDEDSSMIYLVLGVFLSFISGIVIFIAIKIKNSL